MLDMDCTSYDEPVAVTHQTSQCHNVFRRTERGRQEPIAMQLLNPLAVQNVALATRHIFGFSGIAQLDLEAGFLQDFIQMNPINTGGFHRYARHTALFEPRCNLMQVGCKGLKNADRSGVSNLRNTNIKLGGADIHARSIRINWLQTYQFGNLKHFLLAFHYHGSSSDRNSSGL